MFFVYVRSMTTYADHNFKELQINKKAHILLVIAVFNSFRESEDYLLRMGKQITEDFEHRHNQPCVFCITKHHNLQDLDSFEDENISLYSNSQDSFPTYAFSFAGYEMLSHEHFIFSSHDWASLIPEKVAFVVDGEIIYGFDIKDLLHAINIPARDYMDESEKENDKLEIMEYTNVPQSERKIKFERF